MVSSTSSIDPDAQMAPASPHVGGQDASLADRAYRQVEHLIVRLEFRPGQAMSEAEIGARLGMERTPVREALHRPARGPDPDLPAPGRVHDRHARGRPAAPARSAPIARSVDVRARPGSPVPISARRLKRSRRKCAMPWKPEMTWLSSVSISSSTSRYRQRRPTSGRVRDRADRRAIAALLVSLLPTMADLRAPCRRGSGDHRGHARRSGGRV